jgi:hypothetical protein
LSNFRQTLQPEGALEDILVEKLAITCWRYRRLLSAETAEIHAGTEFLQADQFNQSRAEAEKLAISSPMDESAGLIYKIDNPQIVECCLELLHELRESAENGFNKDRDLLILGRLYGFADQHHLHENLSRSYANWLEISETPEEELSRQNYPSPEHCAQNLRREIDAEIKRLKAHKEKCESLGAARLALETVRLKVPESPTLDRLLRYETSLERAFDRTLNQLERLQRLRLGQPVAPRMDVNLSS